MARTVKTITIPGNDRDAGKVFIITEMSARDGHKWATRAIFALMNSGFDVPDDLEGAGFAGLATLGVKAIGNANYDGMEPLLDELLARVQFVPDASKPNVMLSDLERHIEEIKTFFLLQKEALMMHVEPFTAGVKSSGELTPGATAPAG